MEKTSTDTSYKEPNDNEVKNEGIGSPEYLVSRHLITMGVSAQLLFIRLGAPELFTCLPID